MWSSDCQAISESNNSDTVKCGSQEGDSVMSKSLAEEPGALNFITRLFHNEKDVLAFTWNPNQDRAMQCLSWLTSQNVCSVNSNPLDREEQWFKQLFCTVNDDIVDHDTKQNKLKL